MLFDLHVHSAEGSPCASIKNEELVRAYKEKGFDGFVLTNHFARWAMENRYNLSYKDFCKYFYEVYLDAKEHADKIGLKVLFGQELKIDCTGSNDYLVYGLSYEQMLEYDDIMTWTPQKLKEVSEKDGFVFYQAHPFRNHMKIVPTEYLYGVEAFNGCHEDNFIDNIASMWAEKFGLRKIAGSDCHELGTVGRAGVKFLSEIRDNNDLVYALMNKNYYLVENVL